MHRGVLQQMFKAAKAGRKALVPALPPMRRQEGGPAHLSAGVQLLALRLYGYVEVLVGMDRTCSAQSRVR